MPRLSAKLTPPPFDPRDADDPRAVEARDRQLRLLPDPIRRVVAREEEEMDRLGYPQGIPSGPSLKIDLDPMDGRTLVAVSNRASVAETIASDAQGLVGFLATGWEQAIPEPGAVPEPDARASGVSWTDVDRWAVAVQFHRTSYARAAKVYLEAIHVARQG